MTSDAGSSQPPWGAPPPPPPAGRPSGFGPVGSSGWGSPPRDHPNGTTVLVLGILSLVVCGVCGPFAWSMGNTALREMDAQPGVTFSNRGNVTAGRICGIIGTVFLALGILWFVVWVGIIAVMAAG